MIRYCNKCVLPSSRPNLVIESDGTCNACKSTSNKKEVNWEEREKHFLKLVNQAKDKKSSYDCLIPVSGGKDSTWQTLKCLEYGLRPLTFSYAPPLRTEIGRNNLQNLIGLGVDHIDYRVNPDLEKAFLLECFEKKGNIGTPMHTAIFSIARILAYNFSIPLIIWGEDSSVEYGGKKDHGLDYEQNESWLKKFGVGYGSNKENLFMNGFSKDAAYAYNGVSDGKMKEKQIISIFLGYFFKWDPERTKDVAIAAGMKINEDTTRLGYWNYADLDDELISVHHHLKWYKFGFTRLFDNLSVEIRNGRLERKQAMSIISDTGDQTPPQDIKTFCKFVGITRGDFEQTMEKFRNREIWKKVNQTWLIPNFIVKDWSWV
jgi:N-acetyl sugar amidotransferase